MKKVYKRLQNYPYVEKKIFLKMTRNKEPDYSSSHYNRFESKISKLFDDFLNDVGFARTHHGSKFRGNTDSKPTWSPAIDIVENEREYNNTADVPVSFSLNKRKKIFEIYY